MRWHIFAVIAQTWLPWNSLILCIAYLIMWTAVKVPENWRYTMFLHIIYEDRSAYRFNRGCGWTRWRPWTCRPSVLIDGWMFSLQHILHVSLVSTVVFLNFRWVWTIVDMSWLISYQNWTAMCRNRIVLSINHDLLIVLSSH